MFLSTAKYTHLMLPLLLLLVLSVLLAPQTSPTRCVGFQNSRPNISHPAHTRGREENRAERVAAWAG